MTAEKPHSPHRGLASCFCLQWWKTRKPCKHNEIPQKLLRLRRDGKVLIGTKGHVKTKSNTTNNIEKCKKLHRATTSALPADNRAAKSACRSDTRRVGWRVEIVLTMRKSPNSRMAATNARHQTPSPSLCCCITEISLAGMIDAPTWMSRGREKSNSNSHKSEKRETKHRNWKSRNENSQIWWKGFYALLVQFFRRIGIDVNHKGVMHTLFVVTWPVQFN